MLPVAMTATLVGTAWIGLAGGAMISGAQAQRSDGKDDEDRRKRGGEKRPERQERQERQERPAPRATPATPQAPRTINPSPPRATDAPPRTVPGNPPQQRIAPDTQRNPPQQRVAPQPDPRANPGFGRATPPSGPPTTTSQPPRQVAPQPQPLAPRDDPRRALDRPPARDLPGRGQDSDRARRDGPPQRDPVREVRPPQVPGKGQIGDRPVRPGRDFGREGPQRLDDVKKGRVERTEGGRRIIEEPGNRFIIREKGRTVIRRDEGRAFERYSPNARTRDLGEGRRESYFERPDGSRVYTDVDRNGRLLRRYRRDRSGREIVLIDNRRFYRNVGIGLGVTALGIGVGLALAPPAYSLPREKYIVEYEDASDDDLYEALSSPPVAQLERPYSLEEIRYSRPLREYMRRIDLDTINFEFGSFEVGPDQYPKLERLARIIERMLQRNEAEVFLIEGHTDAVGSDEDNLTLSDRRAESVAEILMSQFQVPIENLVTQGYGEQFLKVETQEPDRFNRRVAFRRITPLLGLADR
jgi:outer membrane protein OmpA-like peptidoglycan-associated protein